jgi:hypothetical protein
MERLIDLARNTNRDTAAGYDKTGGRAGAWLSPRHLAAPHLVWRPFSPLLYGLSAIRH